MNRPHTISTSSLVVALATIYSWLFEWFITLLQFFGGQKVDLWTHVVLLTVSASLSLFAWMRREEFRAILGTFGQAHLTPTQQLVVVTFVMAIVAAVMWACYRVEAN